MPWRVRTLPWAAALTTPLFLAGCGTPSRRLPPRVIDDPVTLPRRMIQAGGSVGGTLRDQQGERSGWAWPSFAYGVSNRVTVGPLEGVTVALLDDAPPEHAATGARAATSPFALAIKAQAEAGFSSSEGFLLAHDFGAELRKRIGDRVRVDADVTAGFFISDRRRKSVYHLGIDMLVQITRTLAIDGRLYDHWEFGGLTPASAWTRRSWGVTPSAMVRPCHWLTVGLFGEMELERRPPVVVLVTPETPARRPGADPEAPVLWSGLWARFHW